MQLSNALLKEMSAFFADKPIACVWLFGSYARGDATVHSDIDLLVRFEEDAFQTGMEYFNWWTELERILQRPIDFVAEGALSRYVVPEVEKDKVLIYEKR